MTHLDSPVLRGYGSLVPAHTIRFIPCGGDDPVKKTIMAAPESSGLIALLDTVAEGSPVVFRYGVHKDGKPVIFRASLRGFSNSDRNWWLVEFQTGKIDGSTDNDGFRELALTGMMAQCGISDENDIPSVIHNFATRNFATEGHRAEPCEPASVKR